MICAVVACSPNGSTRRRARLRRSAILVFQAMAMASPRLSEPLLSSVQASRSAASSPPANRAEGSIVESSWGFQQLQQLQQPSPRVSLGSSGAFSAVAQRGSSRGSAQRSRRPWYRMRGSSGGENCAASECTFPATTVESAGADCAAGGGSGSSTSSTRSRGFALNISCMTWASDSLGLFDYESRNVFRRQYRIACMRKWGSGAVTVRRLRRRGCSGVLGVPSSEQRERWWGLLLRDCFQGTRTERCECTTTF